MCDKDLDRCFLVFDSVPNQYKIQEMCSKVVSEDPSLIVYCSNTCKTKKMCDEAFDNSLTALKCIPDWFENFYGFICR